MTTTASGPPAQVNVRAAEAADAARMYCIQDAAVLASWRTCYDHDAVDEWTLAARGLDERHFLARMAVATSLVAEVAGEGVVGFGEVSLDSAELTLLYVDPAWMGRGVGEALLLALEDLARAHGLTELNLFASLNAVPFYERRGWRPGAFVEHRGPTLSIRCLCMLRDLPA